MINQGKHSIAGIGVSAIDYESAVSQVVSAAKNSQAMTVTALAVHGVMTGALDKQHNYRLNQFDLVCPDGQPVRWAMNWLYGTKLKDRVYGPELTLRLCQACAEQNLPIYLFGGTVEMLASLQENMLARFPGLKIAGVRASRFRQLTTAERDELAKEINQSGAKVCFVGIGCPRQETFSFEMKDYVAMPLIAVGAAFAFHAGMLAQAPPWMQKRGLEWFYRLIREPKRLWRRYMYLNPLFVSMVTAQRFKLFRAPTDQGVKPEQEFLYG